MLLDFYYVHIWYLILLILSNVLPIPVVEPKCQMLYYSILLDTNILLILRFHIVNLILRMTSRLVLIPISNWISSNSIQKVNLSYVSQCAAKTLFRYDVQVFSLLSYLQLSEYVHTWLFTYFRAIDGNDFSSCDLQSYVRVASPISR